MHAFQLKGHGAGVRLFLTVGGWNTSVVVGFCPRCNDEFPQFARWTLVMIGRLCS